MIILLFAFVIGRLIRYRQLRPASPLNLCLVLLLISIVLSAWTSPYAGPALEIAGYLSLGIAVYFALTNWPRSRSHPFFIVVLLLAISTLLALIGPLLFSITPLAGAALLPWVQLIRPLSVYVVDAINPNILADALLPSIPLAAAVLLDAARRQRSGQAILGGVCLLVLCTSLLLTQSRAGIASAVCALAIVFVLYGRRFGWRYARIALAMLGIGVLVTGLFFSANGLIDGETLQGRQQIWARSLYALNDFPLTGLGLGAYEETIALFYPFLQADTMGAIPNAHQHWLQISLDLGLPGLIIYVALQLNLLVMVAVVLRQTESDRGQTLIIGAAGALATAYVSGLFGLANWGTKTSFVPWIVIALVVILHGRLYNGAPTDRQSAAAQRSQSTP